MGIDYSFEVYVHRDRAAGFLADVAALCDPWRDEHTTVALPDGGTMRMPGSYGWMDGRTAVLADLARTAFDLSLCFPLDGPLRAYCDLAFADRRDDRCPWPDGSTRARVAVTYLSVWDGSGLVPGHWLFVFTPATSEQSRLWLTSPVIRRTFATLALRAGSPLCLLDVEERYAIVVTGPRREVSVEVPGPCLLWDIRAPRGRVYRELLARLAPAPPIIAPRWILGPGHAAYAGFVEDLDRHSKTTGAVRSG